MADDLMSSDQWSAVWKARALGGAVKDRVKNWVLRDFLSLLQGWALKCESSQPKVIELGCAPGVMLNLVNRALPQAVLRGVDYSQEGLLQTKQRLQHSGIAAELLEGDIYTLNPEQKSDLVVSFGLIEHFSDPADMLRQHRKFARPGGWVAVTVPNFSHRLVHRALQRYRPKDLETHNLGIMSEQALQQAFRDAGFDKIETGYAIGPLLPSPDMDGPERYRLYSLVSRCWNTLAGILPASWFWPGLYWACGQVPAIQDCDQENG